MTKERILVVDDEPGVREALLAVLSDEGFRIELAESGEAGLDALSQSSFDAILLDVWLPGIDGLETLRQIRRRGFDPAVVMISGHGTIETAVQATKLGAFDFVEKPLSLERTLLVMSNALRQRRLERTNSRLLQVLARDTEILGQSEQAESLRRQVEIAAQAAAPVWIRGEQGTGREMVARRIHAAGGRPDAPFVDFRCAALDAKRVETGLFGVDGRPGQLDLASGGTLYLEHVDQLPTAVQSRLAAALAVPDAPRPIGSLLPGRDVSDSGLRTQLDVIRIDVPALRDRREDLELVAKRFIEELSREYGRQPPQISSDGLAALAAHDWPGNVRELRNLIERLVLRGVERITAAELPDELAGSASTPDLYGAFPSLDEGIRAFQRFHVQRVMTEQNGDAAAAARQLGISVTTLRRRLREL